ncbi:MAG TPA: hypothetical protein PKA27_10895 [Fimbriimonadaceae bacterium]|nr:hypothetical protein [Fimbriimonadaceae bacterium]
MAQKVKPDIANEITSQGFYVAGADGSAYQFNNNRSVERVLAMMDRGLAGFRTKPPVKVTIEQGTYGFKRPDDVIAVRVWTRIRPVPTGSDTSNETVAQDHLWIRRSELETLNTGKLPDSVLWRIARFHLVDNVRGEPNHWGTGEVKEARADGLKVSFKMATADTKRGFEGNLELAVKGDSVRGFGEATAWGAGTYTPNPPPGKFKVVFAFTTVNDEVARVVAPQAAFYGNEYWAGR